MKHVKLSDVISNSNQLLVLQVNERESIEKKTRENVEYCKTRDKHTHTSAVYFLWSGKRHFIGVFTTTNEKRLTLQCFLRSRQFAAIEGHEATPNTNVP